MTPDTLRHLLSALRMRAGPPAANPVNAVDRPAGPRRDHLRGWRTGLSCALVACAASALQAAPAVECRFNTPQDKPREVLMQATEQEGRLAVLVDGKPTAQTTEWMAFPLTGELEPRSPAGHLRATLMRYDKLREVAPQDGEGARIRQLLPPFAADQVKRVRGFDLGEKPTKFGSAIYWEFFGENDTLLARAIVLLFFSPCL